VPLNRDARAPVVVPLPDRTHTLALTPATVSLTLTHPCPSVSPRLSVRPSVCLSVCLPVRPSVCLSVCLSLRFPSSLFSFISAASSSTGGTSGGGCWWDKHAALCFVAAAAVMPGSCTNASAARARRSSTAARLPFWAPKQLGEGAHSKKKGAATSKGAVPWWQRAGTTTEWEWHRAEERGEQTGVVVAAAEVVGVAAEVFMVVLVVVMWADVDLLLVLVLVLVLALVEMVTMVLVVAVVAVVVVVVVVVALVAAAVLLVLVLALVLVLVLSLLMLVAAAFAVESLQMVTDIGKACLTACNGAPGLLSLTMTMTTKTTSTMTPARRWTSTQGANSLCFREAGAAKRRCSCRCFSLFKVVC
jgi:hypothetical protein